MKVAGWTWNPGGYGLDWAAVMERAKMASLEAVIIKWGRPEGESEAALRGFCWGTENYVYPTRPEWEGNALADAVGAGADFAVMNAEVEWEKTNGSEVHRMCKAFRERCPDTPLYACTDMRGDRRNAPYTVALATWVDAWLPMIYPLAFGQSVADAWQAGFPGRTWMGLPVWPVIQTYDDPGEQVAREQVAEARRRGCERISIYTIEAATLGELAAVAEEADRMTPEEERRLKLLEDTRWVDQRALIIMAAYRAAGVPAIKDAVAELWYVANAPSPPAA